MVSSSVSEMVKCTYSRDDSQIKSNFTLETYGSFSNNEELKIKIPQYCTLEYPITGLVVQLTSGVMLENTDDIEKLLAVLPGTKTNPS